MLHLNPLSGRWMLDASHLQRHINSAIAYNVWNYYQATHDIEFLASFGAEVILEIARYWSSAATFNPALGRYEILGVIGPDEYHDGYPGAVHSRLEQQCLHQCHGRVGPLPRARGPRASFRAPPERTVREPVTGRRGGRALGRGQSQHTSRLL